MMPFQEGGRKVYLALGCPGGVLWSQEKAEGLLSTASSLLVAVDALIGSWIHTPSQAGLHDGDFEQTLGCVA